MATSFITPILCSFATIVLAVFSFEYYKMYKIDTHDASTKRMFFFMIIVLIVFIVGTVAAYLMSFDMI
ncbi:MAG: hypothetical protein KRP56_04025 [Candidatus Methanogranum gryphiswaldense]|nr:MAG: hypothetical protein KRP56_04025 [Candidatus Methanogranum sp. U3.2.1]